MSIENIAGSNVLLGGDGNYGYLGTVKASEFITGDALASLVGLSSGTSQHSTTDWLKFASNGKIIFSPMKPIRYSLSWNHINSANAVYGSKTVNIGGLTFKVRLWRGAQNDPSNYTDSDRDAIGSEWNKLMLPIHENAPSSWVYTQYGGTTEDWGINFTDADLLTHYNRGNGSYTWCQETRGDDTARRVVRGSRGVSHSSSHASSDVASIYGWRPVLELVDYTFEDTQNQAPTVAVKTTDNKPITPAQFITIPTETSYQFKITASDEDADQALQYKVSVGGVNTIPLTSITADTETTVTIDKSNLIVGMNAVAVTVIDSEGAETTFQFNIIVDANMPIDSSCLANMKFNGYSLSTISLAELVNHLE